MRKNKVIYQLNIEDVQNVAEQQLDRKLTNAEIEKILDRIADNLPWYDAVADAIHEFIGPSVDGAEHDNND